MPITHHYLTDSSQCPLKHGLYISVQHILAQGDRDEDLITNEDIAKSDARRLHTVMGLDIDAFQNQPTNRGA